MIGKLLKATLTAVAVVLVAELAARAVVARQPLAHSYDFSRNPNYRRGWVAWTEPRPREPDERLIVLISNSQGFAPEIPEDERIYSARLARRLDEAEPTHRHIVANWSIGGGGAPEMVLLAARAVEHRPDLLMVVTHNTPFTRKRARDPLSFYISDTIELAYLDSVRDRLPGWFLRAHRACDPGTFLAAQSGLVQLRNRWIEHRDRRWVREARPPRIDLADRDHGNAAVGQSGDLRLRLLVNVFRSGCPDAPVLLVNMPLYEPGWKPHVWPALAEFDDRMAGVVEGVPGVTVLNAVNVVGHDRFYTHTHMTAQGHEAFARWLTPRVLERIAPPPPRLAEGEQ